METLEPMQGNTQIQLDTFKETFISIRKKYLIKISIQIGSVTQVGNKDRIGCGINCSNMSFFFTKNDEIIAKDLMLPEGSKWSEFYPAVALQRSEETVKCYFEKKDFLFDIDKLASSIQ